MNLRYLLNNSVRVQLQFLQELYINMFILVARGTPYRIPNAEWSDVAQLPTEKFVDMRGIPVSKTEFTIKTKREVKKKNRPYTVDGKDIFYP